MLKKKLRKRIILLLLFSATAYLIIGIIPWFQGKEIHVNEHQSFKHTNDNGYYRLQVEPHDYYIFHITYTENDELNPQIRLFSRSYKTIGIQKESVAYGHISLCFYAEHQGNYYVTVTNSKGGYFAVNLEKNFDQNEMLYHTSYVNPLRLIIIITIALLFSTSVIISLVNYSQNKKKEDAEWEIKNMVICPTCGIKYNKRVQYCATCGYTFEKPKEYNNY